MTRGRALGALVIASLTGALPAWGAEDDGAGWHFLPGAGRVLSRSRSASRDAPAPEYAYGPRAVLSLGLDLGLLSHVSRARELRIGTSLLFAGERRESGDLAPDFDATRDLETLSLALAWPGGGQRESVLEITLLIGHEGSHVASGPVDPYRTTDIPFGGGGWFMGADVALRERVSSRLSMTARLGDRMFTNAFPEAVGEREASNYVADYLGEGLTHAAFGELELRMRMSERLAPVLTGFGEALLPHDDSAKPGVRLRVLGALAIGGKSGELWPLGFFEAGNGYGAFINRRELTLGLGVRYVPR